MSFIDHNCERGHPALLHGPVRNSRERVCHCGCDSVRPAESVVIETIDNHGRRTPLIHPGTRVPFPPPRLMACDCAQCLDLYEQVMADA